MGIPWYLKPNWLLHAELLDEQEELNRSASASYSRDREQDRRMDDLQGQIRELQAQLLALEDLLAEKGLLPPRPLPPEEEAQPPAGEPVTFPARTEEVIACPRCGKRQRGDRDACYSCKTPFRYEGAK